MTPQMMMTKRGRSQPKEDLMNQGFRGRYERRLQSQAQRDRRHQLREQLQERNQF